jgi:predicted porin
MNLDDGSGQASNTNNQASGGPAAGLAGGQGLTFARRSTVSLLSRSWGELRIGRDLVPQYLNHAAGDPFGNVGVGVSVNYAANISGVTNTRASNSIAYISPVRGGFAVQAMHYRGENASNVANSDDGTGNGLRLTYGSGPLSVAAGWGRTEYLAGDATQTNLYAGYDFGVVRLMGTINRDKTGAVNARGGVIGAVVPVGVGELKAAYSSYEIDTAGNPQARKLAVGYVHNLSKRTALYGTYARVRNSGGSAMALNGSATAPNASSSGFDLGIRHAF